MITIRDKVRFVETDMMGVVHHANYLRWFEMGRVAYLRACGISLGELMADGVIFPITEVRAKYKNSCTFDDDFEVQEVAVAKFETERLVLRPFEAKDVQIYPAKLRGLSGVREGGL